MNAQREHSEHHVVGPVHVLALQAGDADSIASALQQERDDCAAARVIIDISDFDGAMEIVVEGAQKGGWDHDVMVRTADQRHLTLEEFETEAGQSAS